MKKEAMTWDTRSRGNGKVDSREWGQPKLLELFR
jgi:hypothetical protein